MPIEDEDMIVSTVDFFVTENTLNPKATAAEIAAFVRKLKTTGQITYTTNEGGVRSVKVVERTRPTDAEANEIRRIMGMDYEVEVDGDEEE
jgi:hypothetical protein